MERACSLEVLDLSKIDYGRKHLTNLISSIKNDHQGSEKIRFCHSLIANHAEERLEVVVFAALVTRNQGLWIGGKYGRKAETQMN